MKALIFGRGYLGTAYLASRVFDDAALSDADITDFAAVRSALDIHRPDAVINCAGKTNLEWCRDHPVEAIASNVAGPMTLLGACRERGIRLVHLGSGCIFEGTGREGNAGFHEADLPNPQAFYSATKAAADDLLIRSGFSGLLILRIRQPFGDAPHPRNLITKLLGYTHLITSQNSMTYVPDLIRATRLLLEKNANGIVHAVNPGALSPYEIVMLGREILGVAGPYVPITKAELDRRDRAAGREKRVDAILDARRLAEAGIALDDARTQMRRALERYRSALGS